MLLYEVTFQLKGRRPEEYDALCSQFAPAFLGIPGLVHKVWIRDGDRYGGVYRWRDRDSLEVFLGSELDAATSPHFGDVRTAIRDVLERPTAVTTPTVRPAPAVGEAAA